MYDKYNNGREGASMRALRLPAGYAGLGVDAAHVNRILDGSGTLDSAIASFRDANDMLLITKNGDLGDSHILNRTSMAQGAA
jgi:hypothetical protein